MPFSQGLRPAVKAAVTGNGVPAKQRRPRSLSAGTPLLTKSVRTREVVVAQGPFAPGHLGELTQLVPFEMVDEARPPPAVSRRQQ
jgi:hypothetical protein